jgi:Arc/MetJ-type ribon-helix-helix transcriptional regulator
MSQKKNTVQLSSTAISRLQKLVDSGEYCSIDDAANYVVMSVLSSSRSSLAESGLKNESTRQYLPVLEAAEHKSIPTISTTHQKEAKPPAPITGL